ncbi:MAG TPA: class I SAM-dependent methyltransferase [Deltaproteobacteria bacterium]|jgi:SAM-dependent methyltransferase|nr:class I SAM-dependent methyltransferase [Deltaproteobacteria bacterium]HQI00990.1 class I SAM-dependent methyltransferase [Deltaproteobacteria bacterium]
MQLHDSFKPEYFPLLYRLEAGSFWFQHRTRLILGAIAHCSPAPKNVLEIGCGTGFALAEIRKTYPDATLSGSDLFTESLHFASMRVPTASFYQMDAYRMPFNEEFDLILALDILEHIDNDSRVLSEIFRSLSPGGRVIVTVPQHRWLWSIQDVKAFHRRRYTRRELVGKMRHEGFKIACVTSFITLLLPLMVLSRLYGRFAVNARKEYDPLRELKMHPLMNRIMGRVCRVEERVLQRGIKLPTGGSLLCIGVKELGHG